MHHNKKIMNHAFYRDEMNQYIKLGNAVRGKGVSSLPRLFFTGDTVIDVRYQEV